MPVEFYIGGVSKGAIGPNSGELNVPVNGTKTRVVITWGGDQNKSGFVKLGKGNNIPFTLPVVGSQQAIPFELDGKTYTISATRT